MNDLLWLMEGHYIENDIDLALYWKSDWREHFRVLSSNPERLVSAIQNCKSHFLGSYFEVLFSFAIRYFSTVTILLEHVQISVQGRTLGEVDMLVETPEGELLQFEIAIKFYLERPDLQPDNWIGPNKSDSLRKKTERAREHQLTILDTDAAQTQLHGVLQGRPVKTCLLVYGRLFLSLNNSTNIANQIEKTTFGGWIYISRVWTLFNEFSCVAMLKKPHWLSLQNLTHSYVPFTADCIDAWFKSFGQDSRPIQLCLWNDSREMAPSKRYSVFVVPDVW